MSDDFKVFSIFGLVMVATVCAMFFGIIKMTEKQCLERWGYFNPSFAIIGGCMIEVDGKRIPSEAYREMP